LVEVQVLGLEFLSESWEMGWDAKWEMEEAGKWALAWDLGLAKAFEVP